MTWILLLIGWLLVAAPAYGQSARLSWSDQSDNEEGFRCERQANGGSFFQVADVGMNVQTWTDTQVLYGAPYCWRCLAYNTVGVSGYTNTACMTPTAQVPDTQLFLMCMQTEVSSPTLIAAMNFQPTASPIPSGYLKDDGSLYSAARGYGWTLNLGGQTRDRNLNPDQRLDTLVATSHDGAGTLATWNYNLPNGAYLISLASGDPGYAQGPHRVEVEGIVVVNNIPTTANTYVTITDFPVVVSDGQLSVKLGGTAGNSMLNYLEIRSQ